MLAYASRFLRATALVIERGVPQSQWVEYAVKVMRSSSIGVGMWVCALMRIQYMQVMLKEQVAAENACGRVADEVAVLTMLDHPNIVL
jgi:hypothetical protein